MYDFSFMGRMVVVFQAHGNWAGNEILGRMRHYEMHLTSSFRFSSFGDAYEQKITANHITSSPHELFIFPVVFTHTIRDGIRGVWISISLSSGVGR